MANWQRGQKEEAGQWYQAAVLRMQFGLPFRWDPEVWLGLRREAEGLMVKPLAFQAKVDDPEYYSRIIAAQPEAAWAYQLRGQIHRRLGKTKQADADARRAAELLVPNLPTGPDALKELERAAMYYCRANSWDMGIIAYSKAIQLKDDELRYYRERGWAYLVCRQYAEAATDYTKAIALNPRRGDLYARRGYAYLQLSEHDKALADYAKVLELNPDYSGDGWSRYCAQHLGAGLYLKAVELGATAEQRSRFFKDYLDLVWSLIHSNPRRLNEAEKLCRQGITMVEQILARSPDAATESWQLADLRSALGWTFQHGKQPAAAVKAFREEIDLREKLAGKFGSKKEQRWHLCRAYTFLGIAQSSAGHLKEAEKAHRQALAATEQLANDFPKEASYQQRVALCHMNLGFVLHRTAHLDDTERHFQEAVRMYEGHPEWKDDQGILAQSLFGLAQILSKKGRNEEAAKTYRRFLELQPASPVGNNNAAWFLATCADPKFRDPSRAVKLAQKATELAPMEGTYWNTLGAAHYRAGNWKEAIAGLEKSMELRKGGDSFDWFFLAMAHWKLGEKEKARTRFDQAVEWMDKHQPRDEELRRFRAEAAELLGVSKKM
jgi:tetratricopeptide (TPR) repeat protein